MEEISSHLDETLKFIQHCQELKPHQLKLTEFLTQDLIKIDGMLFCEEDKHLRKEWILFIQNLLGQLDQIHLIQKK